MASGATLKNVVTSGDGATTSSDAKILYISLAGLSRSRLRLPLLLIVRTSSGLTTFVYKRLSQDVVAFVVPHVLLLDTYT